MQRFEFRGMHPSLPARVRVRLDVESPWLTGRFTGEIVARPGPELRAQFFPDLGGKAIDLLATRERVVGWFPHARSGIDVRLAEGPRPHPLLFMGLQLLEEFAPLDRDRLTGWIEDRSRPRMRWDAVAPGARVEAVGRRIPLSIPILEVVERRFFWRGGFSWTSRREAGATLVEAPGMRMRVEPLGFEHPKEVPDSAFELVLPPEATAPGR
jgi:hypothetical protein